MQFEEWIRFIFQRFLWLSWPVGEAGKCSVLRERRLARALTPSLMVVCGWGGMGSSVAQEATSPTDRLVKAMQENNVQAAEEALNQGASTKVEVEGTPIPFVAAFRGRTGILKALLDHGVRPDICSEVDHTSLLIYATHMGDPSIIRMLLDHKAPVNVRNNMGETALTVVRNPDPPKPRTRAIVMRMLLHAGADPEIRDREGCTAIMRYATYGISDAVEVLADAGVNINARDRAGNTALILAAAWRIGDTGVPSPEAYLAIVCCLLKHGADLNAKNHDGLTALMAARQYHHFDMVSLLRDRGATEGPTGQLPLVPEFLQQAQQTANEMRDSEDKIDALKQIAAMQVRADDRVGALQTILIAKQIAEKDKDTSALLGLAEVGGRAGDVVNARQMLEHTEDGVYHENVLSKDLLRRAIASEQARGRDVADAMQMASSITDDSLKVSALLAIADAQEQSGDPIGAGQTRRTTQQMAEGLRAFPYYNPKAWILLTIATAQAKAGDTSGAERTIHSALSVVKEAGDVDIENCVRHDIAAMQAQMHDLIGARQTASEIGDVGCKTWTLVRIAAAQTRARDLRGSLQTLKDALQTAAGIHDLDDRGTALAAIAQGQARARDIRGAQQTARAIRKARDRDTALPAIVEAQTDARDLAAAKRTTAEMHDAEARAGALVRIAEAQDKVGDRIGTKQTLHSAVQTAEGIGDLFEKERVLLAIAETQSHDPTAAGQMIRRAQQAAHVISNADDKAAALQNIAETQTRLGDRKGAIQTVKSISKARTRVFALVALASLPVEKAQEKQ